MKELEVCPKISIIVITYNMVREAKRTLFSLSTEYQKDILENDYEVIVIDNGSTDPLSKDFVISFGNNFEYYFYDTKSPSPASAINFGVAKAKGKFVGLMIDGARILSPGLLRNVFDVTKIYNNPIIATLSWHLGPKNQSLSIQQGYDQKVEDNLLSAIPWRENGYKLFEISSLAGSCKDGFFRPIAESNCLFILKDTFVNLGGFDENFQLPGGGLVNLDFYNRACALDDTVLVVVLGEGTFHQIHNGVSTNIPQKEKFSLWERFENEYINIRKERHRLPNKLPVYFGRISHEFMPILDYSTKRYFDHAEVELQKFNKNNFQTFYDYIRRFSRYIYRRK